MDESSRPSSSQLPTEESRGSSVSRGTGSSISRERLTSLPRNLKKSNLDPKRKRKEINLIDIEEDIIELIAPESISTSSTSIESTRLIDTLNQTISQTNNTIEPVKMTTNNYGMPALSAEAKAEIDKASEKLPRKYKTAPLFDITDPSQMIPWFEATNLPFAADVPKTDRNYLQALKPKVEDEFKDLLEIKLESLIPRELTEEQQQMVALNKDLMEANMKEIRAVKSLQSHFKEGADIMTQLTAVMAQMAKENAKGMINSIPPSGPSNQSNRFKRNTTPRSSNGTQGWMMPEGGDSKRYKLRDNARMPRDDPNIPRYKKIEQMAKDLGWDHAESYFANMEDDEDDKVMDQQMNPNVNLAVWMTRIEELSDRLGNLEAHQEDDVHVFNQDSSNGKK
ncbi:hypothetical protein F5877DRAFT_86554 [Lentinula edodes]|nr:hypothetical protein F5877DRAFT_86554 [Lentinula edodes]